MEGRGKVKPDGATELNKTACKKQDTKNDAKNQVKPCRAGPKSGGAPHKKPQPNQKLAGSQSTQRKSKFKVNQPENKPWRSLPAGT